jgi:hypothetical protein
MRLNSCVEIQKSRDNAWTMFDSRKHTVLRVYSYNERGDDLLFIGHVAMDLKKGKHVAGEFTGRFQIADVESSSPKLKSYSIWAVRITLAPILLVNLLSLWNATLVALQGILLQRPNFNAGTSCLLYTNDQVAVYYV